MKITDNIQPRRLQSGVTTSVSGSINPTSDKQNSDVSSLLNSLAETLKSSMGK
jgi:hypothetical protein